MNKYKMVKKSLTILILCFAAFICLTPFLWMISGSFKSFIEFYRFPPSLIPDFFHLQNYRDALTLVPLVRFIMNSIFLAAVVTACQVITSSMSGFALATMEFKGRDVIFLTFLSGLMIPFQVILIPLFMIITHLGLVNTYWALILPFVFTPFGVFLTRQFFKSIPKDLFEAGKIDGASDFRVFISIYLPLSTPVVSALSILCFIFFYNNLLWPMIVIRTQSLQTVSLGLMSFVGRDIAYPHIVMAGATICIIPTLLVFLCLQKYFIRGITMSGIKG